MPRQLRLNAWNWCAVSCSMSGRTTPLNCCRARIISANALHAHLRALGCRLRLDPTDPGVTRVCSEVGTRSRPVRMMRHLPRRPSDWGITCVIRLTAEPGFQPVGRQIGEETLLPHKVAMAAD